MDLFDRFLQERTYLKGVFPTTLRWYACVRAAFQPILTDPTRVGMLECVQGYERPALCRCQSIRSSEG
jgi:hypothetical protein